MTLLEIRETIEQDRVALDGEGFGIVQKQITLQANQLHQVLKVDFFQDTLPSYQGAAPLFIELMVTPYPVIYSDMKFSTPLAYGSRAPMAGSDTILFKTTIGPYDEVTNQFPAFRQFPNESVGATPTFSFYTPYVYVTAFLHGEPALNVDGLGISFYMAIDSKKANLTSYGLGVMRERSVAQGINLMNQGRTILPARNVGQVFPMWKYGGIRSERMLRGNAIADFFLPYTPNETEAMTTTANLRTFIKTSRQMQGFDQAFGGEDVAKGQVPDWVRFGLSRGLVAGPIRAQMPPLKYADNGNTLMFA
tara:strand:- start:21 stop:938 length:918 start_codon:yes stop_codon:yes gene_type:complete